MTSIMTFLETSCMLDIVINIYAVWNLSWKDHQDTVLQMIHYTLSWVSIAITFFIIHDNLQW